MASRSLRRHPLSDAPYQNSDIVINEQGPDHHRFNVAPYRNLNMMISERESGRHRLNGALHQHPNVVSNEQGSSRFNQRMRGARKLVGESRIRLGS
jgi:hypothetical protein